MDIIPFTTYPAISKEISLDNKAYKFSFVWNPRMEAWTLSIFDLDDTPILNGIKLVLNYELISMYNYLEIPPGKLFVLDYSDDTSRIAFDDFTGERSLSLVYFSEADLEAIS